MKKFYALLLVVLALFVATSCGNNDGDTIRFTVRSGIVSKALETLNADFAESGILEKYGLDYEIKIDAITGGYDDLRTAIVYDIGSGNAPDIVMGYPDHFTEYYNGGALVDLQTYIDDPEYGYTQEELDDFVDSYITENQGFNRENPDHLYGLPFNKSTEVLIYNKTAFEALFGDQYLEKVPTTWKEVEEVGYEIIDLIKQGKLDNTFLGEVEVEGTGEKKEEYLKVSDYLKEGSKTPFYPFGYDSSDNAFITLLRQFGGKYTEREKVSKGYVVFGDAENVDTTKAMLSYFRDKVQKGIFANATTFNSNYCSDAFVDIRCLMTVGSSAGVGYNDASNSEYEYEIAMAPIPYYDEGNGETIKYVIQQGTNVGILNQNDENKRLAAWLFVKFLLEKDNTAKFAIETGGYLPVRESAYETEVYQEFLNNPTDDKVHYSNVAKTARNYLNEGYTFFVDDAFVGSAKIRTASGTIFDKIVISGENADDVLKSTIESLGQAFQKK